MKHLEQEKAKGLRKKGFSIKEIAKRLNVSRGSVSTWVQNIKLTKEQLNKLKANMHTTEAIENRRQKRITNEENKRQSIIKESKKDYDICDKDLKKIGVMLYWAEGGKTQRNIVRFSNSDPRMIKIMMRFFREICHVPEIKFKGHIHTYSNSNVVNSENYWSSITKINKDQFFKTYTKLSKASLKKRKTLPYGTFDIYICDTKLFLQIKGWTEATTDFFLRDKK